MKNKFEIAKAVFGILFSVLIVGGILYSCVYGFIQDSNTNNTTKVEYDNSSSNNYSGQFVGSINSNVYHYPSCGHAKRIKSYNEIWFSSVQDAKNHGYRPCKVCKPPG